MTSKETQPRDVEDFRWYTSHFGYKPQREIVPTFYSIHKLPSKTFHFYLPLLLLLNRLIIMSSGGKSGGKSGADAKSSSRSSKAGLQCK